jgi:hypothetical protein
VYNNKRYSISLDSGIWCSSVLDIKGSFDKSL